jgi:hypothetical protein
MMMSWTPTSSPASLPRAVGAIAEARARAKDHGIDPEFREIVRHAREMHFLLLEALLANEPLSTEYYRGLSESADNSIEQLEALAEMPDGRMQ